MKRYKAIFILVLLTLFITNVGASDSEDVKESGTYFITIGIKDEAGNDAEERIRILITSRNTVVNTNRNEAIDGVDIRYHDDSFFDLSSDDLIRLGNVRAWDTLSAARIEIKQVRINKVSDIRSDIEFSTAQGTKLILNGYKTREGGLDLENTYYSPIRQENYNLPKTIQLLSLLIFIPLLISFVSFTSTKNEYSRVSKTLFMRLKKVRQEKVTK